VEKLSCPVYVHVHPYDELNAILSYRIGESTIQAFIMPEPDDGDDDDN
jgi:hypothetical protein